jgi:triosephosphate isomerase
MILFNWKANGTKKLIEEINNLDVQNKTVGIFPPFHLLHSINKEKYAVGAQNVSQCLNGAYTGEITAQMLEESGVTYCLVGHSERRHYMGETNEMIAKKINHLLQKKITPVLCIGETSLDKANNSCYEVLKNQLAVCQEGCVIAYEPIWAIGTGNTPSNNEINNVCQWLKQEHRCAKVLYGGSVSSSNIAELAKTTVDGLLVGGASLKPEEVFEIIKYF